jgi:hypothetical protein
MSESRSPAEIADEIAALVRTLNYQTGAGESLELEYPGDLYSVVASLKIAAQRLPQLFDQMGRWLADEHRAGRVAHDRGGDAGEYVEAVVDALGRASQDATTLSASLDTAHEMSAGLKASEQAIRSDPDLSL